MAEYIKAITSDHDLIALAKHLGVKLDGILEISEIKKPLPAKGTYIILLRTDGGVGHWTVCVDSHYYDSMGVGPPTVLGDLPYNEHQYQSAYAEYCGPFCMLYIYCRQNNMMDLLKGFVDLDVDAI
jgi:hypothetical protein